MKSQNEFLCPNVRRAKLAQLQFYNQFHCNRCLALNVKCAFIFFLTYLENSCIVLYCFECSVHELVNGVGVESPNKIKSSKNPFKNLINFYIIQPCLFIDCITISQGTYDLLTRRPMIYIHIKQP